MPRREHLPGEAVNSHPTAIKWEQFSFYSRAPHGSVSSIISMDAITRDGCHGDGKLRPGSSTQAGPPSATTVQAHMACGQVRALHTGGDKAPALPVWATPQSGPQLGHQAGEMCPKPGLFMLGMSFFL